MAPKKTSVAFARKSFYEAAEAVGFLRGDGFVSRKIDDNYSFVAVFYPLSKTGRVLAACDAGLLSEKHQRIALEATGHLVGIKARPEWSRFWFPSFTAAWPVSLARGARDSEDVRGFSFDGRQLCWYHAEDVTAAAAELAELTRFLANEGFEEIAKFASDERFPAMVEHRDLAKGPHDVLEAILLYLRGDIDAGRKILRCEIPRKNRFIPEAYPGILERMEQMAGSGRLAALMAGERAL